MRRRLIAGLALASATTLVGSAAQADDPNQCIVKKTSDWGTEVAREKILTTSLFAAPDTPVHISTYGWSDGASSTGSFGLEILVNNVMIAQSETASGDGRLDASASTDMQMDASGQIKITAKPIGRDKSIHRIELRIAVGEFC